MSLIFNNPEATSSRFLREVIRKKVVQIYNNVVTTENYDPNIKSLRTKNLKEDCRELRKDIMDYEGSGVPRAFRDRLMELKATADRLGVRSN